MLPSSVVSLTLQGESNILAVICDDLVVRLFDIETKRLVRELTGFKGRVLDMVRPLFDYFIWLISSMRSGLLSWFPMAGYNFIRFDYTDIWYPYRPTNRCIPYFQCRYKLVLLSYGWLSCLCACRLSWHILMVSACFNLHASLTLGVQGKPCSICGGVMEDSKWSRNGSIWRNWSPFHARHLWTGRSVPFSLYKFGLICTKSTALALEGLTGLGVIESPDVFRTAPPVDGELITLTLLPRARWQTLLHLDVITVSFTLL